MSGEKKYHPCDCDTRMVERFETTGVDGMAESLKRMIEGNFQKSDIVITKGEHQRNVAELAEACSKRSSAAPAYITGNNYGNLGTLTKNADGMVMNSHAADNIVRVSHDNVIDFSCLSEIKVTWSGGNAYEIYQGLGVYATNNPTDALNYLARIHKDNSDSETVTLNVSNVNVQGYIVIMAYNGNLVVSNIEMK